jgi:putative peptidoglycan lipid II flippase
MTPGPDNGTLASTPASPVAGVARAAGIISLGNVSSRLLGMARELVKAQLFGATGLVSAFEVANAVPTMLFDLLVGGMISSALVPVLSDYVGSERARDEFWRLTSTLLSVSAVLLAAIVVLAELLAPQIAWLFGARHFEDPTLWPAATHLLRIILPAILFLSIAGLLTGALYSLKRFTLPAFTAAVFNATVVVVALLNPERIEGLAWGVLAGAVLQVIMQFPHLEWKELRWRWSLAHPALRRMIKLYLPIVLGVVVSQVAIAISYNLATRTGDESVAIMRYATTLIQFPLGLVGTAVSVAILPTLAQQASSHDGDAAFRGTLAQGLNLELVLIIPATIGLFVLARPIVALAFERGGFLPAATRETATVLRFYLIGLPFAAVDQLLIFASYARKNTLAPALVGVLSVVVYLLVAFLLIGPLGLYSLMIADSVKHMVHAGTMVYLLRRRLGGVRDGILRTAAKALLASGLMGSVVWALSGLVPEASTLVHRIILVGGGGLVGLGLYGLLIGLFRVREAQLLWGLIRSRLPRGIP